MSSLICSVSDPFKFINDFEQKEKKVGEKVESLPIEGNVLIHILLRLKFGESCEIHG
jgi:hypothetical protein